MTKELYEEVKHDIPSHIGVYIGFSNVKRAKKQELSVDEQVLKDSMIRSLNREFAKQYKSKNPTIVETLNRRLNRIEKERNEYRRKYRELRNFGYEKYGRGWDKEL